MTKHAEFCNGNHPECVACIELSLQRRPIIDEKRLNHVAVQHMWDHGGQYEWCLGDFTEDEASEVLRLARLGLLAADLLVSEVAIRQASDTLGPNYYIEKVGTLIEEMSAQTIAALPKEKK